MRRLFQGAVAELFASGLFVSKGEDSMVRYVDVRSLYPCIMIMFNLSPETVSLVSKKSYTGVYKFTSPSEIEVPDSYHGQLVLRIDPSDSVSRQLLIDLWELRRELKRIRGDVLAESKEKAVKLLMNQIYGYNGLEFSRYGSFLVAIAVASIGRFIMNEIVGVCRRCGCKPLEADTDGLYYYGRDVVNEVNSHLQSIFKNYKFSDWLVVEGESFDGILVYAIKNYIIFDKGRIKVKGSSFHGRHMPSICFLVLRRFAEAAFRGERLSDVWQEFSDLSKFSLDQFTMGVGFKKDFNSYVDTTLYGRLAEKLVDAKFQNWGGEIYYVKCRDGYFPLGTRSDEEMKRMLDEKYYLDRMREIVCRIFAPILGSPSAVRDALIRQKSMSLGDFC